MSRSLTPIEQDALTKRLEKRADRIIQEKYAKCCGPFGYSADFLKEVLMAGMINALHVFQDFRDEIHEECKHEHTKATLIINHEGKDPTYWCEDCGMMVSKPNLHKP